MSEETFDPRKIPPGTLIGAYEIVGDLGHGGMGNVYRVRRGTKQFALKISSEVQADCTPQEVAALEQRIRREVATLITLKHPNIVHCYGFDKWPDPDTGHIYFVTELIEGDRLYAWRRKRKPSLREIVGVFCGMASGLAEAHHRGVFHRDLKSGNVMVRDDGHPVLIDFGIARVSSAYTLTGLGTMIGTATHFSPALCRHALNRSEGKGHYVYEPYDDLHPLGFMLYEMLAGRKPFDFSNPEIDEWGRLKVIAKEIPAPPSQFNSLIPKQIDSIVGRLLAKEANACFAGGDELLAAFKGALAEAEEAWQVPFEVPTATSGADRNSRESGPGARAPTVAEGPRKVESVPVDLGDFDALKFKTSVQEEVKAPAEASALPPPLPTFKPPTVPSAFKAPDIAAKTPVPSGAKEQAGHLERQALALQGRRSEGKTSRRIAVVLVGAIALLLAVGFFLPAGQGARTSARDLLSKYETDKASELRPEAASPGSGETATPQSAGLPETLVPSGVAAKEPAEESAADESAPTKGTHTSDAAAIDAELREAYAPVPATTGTAHSAPASKGVAKSRGRLPNWVRGAAVVGSLPVAAVLPKKYGIPFGAHIRLRLKSNLDSNTAADGLVEGRLARPYVLGGEVVLPTGTMLYGQARVSSSRFMLHFTKLVLPDKTESVIVADALDLKDGVPGLSPSRQIHNDAPGGDGVVTSVAKGTANVVLGAVGGSGLAGSVGSNAGQIALNHQDTPTNTASQDTLFLDTNADFEVVVREAL